MHASFARLVARGVGRVRLTVEGENEAAVGLYRKVGFVLLREVEDYLGPGESRLLLEASLTELMCCRPGWTGRTD
jgi:ribosomal protein S18 acetylase RimI-like enzyme